MSLGQTDLDAAPTADLAKRAASATTWSEYEDGILALVVRLYDERPASRRGVDSFVLKATLWDMPPEQSLSNDQLLSLLRALESLEARGLIELEKMSGGIFNCRPTRLGHALAVDDEHVAWIDVFDRRIPPEHLAMLAKLHELSLSAEGGVLRLKDVDEAEFLPTLQPHADGSELTYEERMRAHRDLETLVEAGFVKSLAYTARPTYEGCVRLEQRRPLALFPDVLGPLELALGSDERFAGALRKLRDAAGQAAERPSPNAEDAIKNAASALESAFAAFTEKHVDLSKHAEILGRRGVLSRELVAVVQKLDVWRGATAGVAHGGAARPVVDEADARLAIHFAAGLIAYLATVTDQRQSSARASVRADRE